MREHAHPGFADLGDGRTIKDGNHAGGLAGTTAVHPHDARMRVWAAQEYHMRKAGQTQIVDVDPAPLQQAPRVGARIGAADMPPGERLLGALHGQFVARAHVPAPAGLARREASVVSIASTMA